MEKKRSIISTAQKLTLCEWLRSKPHIISGKFTSEHTKQSMAAEWEEIAITLNSDEVGDAKDGAEWKTVISSSVMYLI